MISFYGFKLSREYLIARPPALTPVKVLKKIVPEQIKSAAQDKMPPGETHDVADFCPLLGFIAMDRTIFAGRLRIERTSTPPGDGISQEIPTLRTESVIVRSQGSKGGITGDRLAQSSVMMGVAPAVNKERQQVKVLELFAGQGDRVINRRHGVNIYHPGCTLN